MRCDQSVVHARHLLDITYDYVMCLGITHLVLNKLYPFACLCSCSFSSIPFFLSFFNRISNEIEIARCHIFKTWARGKQGT